jgi:VCBS repeat-containing protein
MRFYRFTFHADGKAQYSTDHQFEDDLDALDAARLLSDLFSIEIWDGARLIAHVKKGNEPLNAQDPVSG